MGFPNWSIHRRSPPPTPHSQANVPKRNYPIESSQEKVSKRTFSNDISKTEVPKRTFPRNRIKAKYPDRKLPSERSQAKIHKRMTQCSYQCCVAALLRVHGVTCTTSTDCRNRKRTVHAKDCLHPKMIKGLRPHKPTFWRLTQSPPRTPHRVSSNHTKIGSSESQTLIWCVFSMWMGKVARHASSSSGLSMLVETRSVATCICLNLY